MSSKAAIGIAEYARRRRALMRAVGDDAVVLVPAAPIRYRNSDAAYPYRQSSDFLYLTGFDEPEALLVLTPGRAAAEQILFCRDHDERAERFDGERLGPDRAAQHLNLDDAFPIPDVDEILPGLMEGRTRIYFAVGADPDFDRRIMSWVNGIRARVGAGALPPSEFVDIGHLLHDLRLVKSAAELRLMREAARISCAAHIRAMELSAPGVSEGDLEAELLYAFRRGGARAAAYESIVAGGDHACTMHYVRNDAPLQDGELVLIDAGCEFAGYASDITRTFPVSGRFSPAQRQVYDLVLEAQHAAIAAVRPGAHFNEPHEAAARVLTRGLVELGLLEGDLDALLAAEAARPWTIHKCSHWLGLDVHDVGDYRLGDAWRDLEAGMVLTIEPGLYFHRDLEGTPARLRGIGVRIEDDVVVTKDGCSVLTDGVPKHADEIEALMASARAVA
ncbi:MAG TPA: aminopeptidase P N-terminal domain-containing protein [Pseudomonadales bacterium]|nr:aminopeptidase P N-terminal domain-containing protein [Pseudomonadales bacterium]